jgi:Kef-type K+ transport system membrane component KefB
VKSALPRLILIVGLLAGVDALQRARGETGTPVALAAGGLLLAALFAGKVATFLHLPRLTGYLLVGVGVGPYALGFIPKDGITGLALISGIAVSLIALSAGTELRLELLQRVGAKVTRMCLLVAVVVFVICLVAVVAIAPWLEFMAEMTLGQKVAAAAVISSVLVSFSPTVGIAVVEEMGARGPFTDFLMAFIILGDLVVLVLFAASVSMARAAFGGAFSLSEVMLTISWELFGSVLVGALLGLILLVYLERVGKEVVVFIIGLCFALAEGGGRLHLSPLLMSLAAGGLLANLSEKSAAVLHTAIQRAGLPVFALFFAAAGAGLHLDTVMKVGPYAVLLALLRAGTLYYTSRRFAPNDEPEVKKLLWMGLISQAGVSFGLASIVERSFPEFGAGAATLLIAIITLHELVGPLLVRKALLSAGEATVSADAPRTAAAH